MANRPDGPKRPGSRVLALKRRLDTDTLMPDHHERLALTRRLRELLRNGKTTKQCAELLGVHPKMLAQFMRRGIYKVFSEHLERLEHGDDAKAIERIVRKARVDFVGLAPDAIEYIRSCFRRDEHGEYLDDGKAMWAAQLVTKGLGLLEPQHMARPVVHISTAVIRAELEQVAEEDAKAEAAWRASTVVPQNAC